MKTKPKFALERVWVVRRPGVATGYGKTPKDAALYAQKARELRTWCARATAKMTVKNEHYQAISDELFKKTKQLLDEKSKVDRLTDWNKALGVSGGALNRQLEETRSELAAQIESNQEFKRSLSFKLSNEVINSKPDGWLLMWMVFLGEPDPFEALRAASQSTPTIEADIESAKRIHALLEIWGRTKSKPQSKTLSLVEKESHAD